MVNFDKFSSENTVIFADFSPKITVVRPKYVSWGSIQEGVLLTRIWYHYQNLMKDNQSIVGKNGDILKSVYCNLFVHYSKAQFLMQF